MEEQRVGDLRGARCLVTGAAGFLGGHLCTRLLVEGAEVVALERDRVPDTLFEGSGARGRATVVQGDLAEPGLLARVLSGYEIDLVVHLAAQSQVGVATRHPLDTFESNVRGTWLLFEAVRAVGGIKGVLLASSDKAYGPSPSLPYTEELTPRPVHPYDTSKLCGELIARSYHASFGVPLVVVRCGNLYGPGDTNWQRLVPGVMRDLLSGRSPVIRSDGTPQRDYVYAPDAVDALVTLLRRGVWDGEVFNVGTGIGTSVLGLVEGVARVLGRPDLPPLIMGAAQGEIPHQVLNPEKLARVAGWRAQTPLEVGLGLTAPWYRARLGVR